VISIDELGVFGPLVAIATVLRQRELLDLLKVRTVRACRNALEVILDI
jgi:hypothetical protein